MQDEEIRMDEGDMYESEVITFVAPKQSGWLKKKSTGEFFFKRAVTNLFLITLGVSILIGESWALLLCFFAVADVVWTAPFTS